MNHISLGIDEACQSLVPHLYAYILELLEEQRDLRGASMLI